MGSFDSYIKPQKNDIEIHKNIKFSSPKPTRLWGQVLDENEKPIKNALLTLVRLDYDKNACRYKSVAFDTTDEYGFYQFNIYHEFEYKIIVTKPNYL